MHYDYLISSFFRMDIDFSPTGREFVTGSYDRSVRIFPYNGGHSREIYHTKRMQRYNLLNSLYILQVQMF